MRAGEAPSESSARAVGRRKRRPYGAPEALRALGLTAWLGGLMVCALPSLRNAALFPEVQAPVPALSEPHRFALALLGLGAGALLWWSARERAQAIVDGALPPGSARFARLTTVVAGVLAAALIPGYYAAKAGRAPTSLDEHLIVFVLGGAALALIWIGLERPLRPGRARPSTVGGPYAPDEPTGARGADLSGWEDAVGPAARPPGSWPRAHVVGVPSVSGPGPQEVRQRVRLVPAAARRVPRGETVNLILGVLLLLLPLALLLLGVLR